MSGQVKVAAEKQKSELVEPIRHFPCLLQFNIIVQVRIPRLGTLDVLERKSIGWLPCAITLYAMWMVMIW
jgi:hypothetical protein